MTMSILASTMNIGNVLVPVIIFLCTVILLVAVLLIAKSLLVASGKVTIDINDGKKP